MSWVDDLNSQATKYASAGANQIWQDKPQAAPQPKPEVGGLTGFLANAAPIIGGVLGTVGGTLLDPFTAGAGTFLGGAAGSGVGEGIKEKLLGQNLNAGDIATSAALGALPGVGKLGKGVIGAVKGVKAGEGAIQGTRTALGLGEAGVSGTPSGLVGKVNQAAQNQDMKQSGLNVGQTVNGQTLTPDRAAALYDFARNGSQKYVKGGVDAGAPISQAGQAQAVHNGVKSALDETLSNIDRPVTESELGTITQDIGGRVKQNTAVTGTTKTSGKLLDKVSSAKSLSDLEAVRREADDLAYTSRGAGKTSAAAQAKDVRDAIDNFITPLSPEYKAVKGDYQNSKDLLELASKNSKSAKGISILGADIGGQAISGNVSRASNTVNKLTGGGKKVDQGALATAFRPSNLLKKGLTQSILHPGDATTALAAPLAGVQPDQSQPDQTSTIDASGLPDMTGANQNSNQSSNDPFSEDGIKQAIANDINKTGGKNTATLLSLYNAFGKPKSSGPNPTAQQSSLAQSGLASLGDLSNQLQSNPGILNRTAIPGQDLPLIGGVVRNAVGTGKYDATANNVLDALARARTGAAMSNEEKAFYQQLLPQAGDNQQTIQTKIAQLQQAFAPLTSK